MIEFFAAMILAAFAFIAQPYVTKFLRSVA